MRPIIRYTALGDSLTVGTGAYFSKGFVERYAKKLELRFQTPVYIEKFSKKGITSGELLAMFHEPTTRNSIYYADVITISIGGNDLLNANRAYMSTHNPMYFNSTIQSLYANIKRIINEIYTIKTPMIKPFCIQILGLYNPFPELPYSNYWVQEFNAAIQSLSSNYNTIRYVNIYPVFTYYGRRALSIDFHPNRKGYQLIAEELNKSLI